MAISYDDITAGSNQTVYNFNFDYIEASDVKVKLNGTDTTAYTLSGQKEVTLNAAPTQGTIVRVYRETNSITPEKNFVSGSTLKAEELNANFKQALYVTQETTREVAESNAGNVITQVTNAVNTANAASTAATNAENTANGIAATANSALTTANTASTNASTALTNVASKADIGANVSIFANDANYITLAQVPTPTIFTTGMIMMFTGSTAPSGWAFCDGNNGTPDLRNRFIVGAGSSYSSGDTGGANDVVLSAAQMPNHAHYFSGSNTHRHDFKGVGGDDHNDSNRKAIVGRNDVTQSYLIYTADNNTGTGVQNTTITISGTTHQQGGGAAHENRPPYYALAYIMKT